MVVCPWHHAHYYEWIKVTAIRAGLPIFTVRKWSLRRLCFHTCLSVHGECLQAHTRGGIWLAGGGRSPGPSPGGRLGGLAGGVSQPILRGEVGGLAREMLGSLARGRYLGPGLGVCIPACTEANPHPPPTQQTATAVDRTYPTGMHSCHINKPVPPRQCSQLA